MCVCYGYQVFIIIRLGTAYSHAGVVGRAAECFHHAEEIYKIVPGEGSTFYRRDFKHIYNKYLAVETEGISITE